MDPSTFVKISLSGEWEEWSWPEMVFIIWSQLQELWWWAGWVWVSVTQSSLDLRSGNRSFLFPLQGRNYFQWSTRRIQGGLVSGIGLLAFGQLAHHYSWRGDDCISIMFSVLTGRFSLHLRPSNYFGAIPLGSGMGWTTGS